MAPHKASQTAPQPRLYRGLWSRGGNWAEKRQGCATAFDNKG